MPDCAYAKRGIGSPLGSGCGISVHSSPASPADLICQQHLHLALLKTCGSNSYARSNPISNYDLLKVLDKLGRKLKPEEEPDYLVLLQALDESVESVMNLPDYEPTSNIERFPQKNVNYQRIHMVDGRGSVPYAQLGLLSMDQVWNTMTTNINGLLLWMHVPSNVGGRTKKSAVSSIMFIAYCVGNAGGSQFFRAADAPGYIPALVACSICLGLEFVFVLTWRIYLSYQNHMRDKVVEAQGLTPEQVKELGAENGEKDITDRKNPHFRYSY
ncbi:hypothetical protein DFH05DRAFT_1538437 [Lentinula detonsa]|uniref:Uncharacterized protein n=1 Tax=Lentinula detonsa TaxID=2804962 RepID=A0A9W8PA22_9AGAR|nr:hypothetical protein DFH05DRAFT_1538437 [Lentinula detonsa]